MLRQQQPRTLALGRLLAVRRRSPLLLLFRGAPPPPPAPPSNATGATNSNSNSNSNPTTLSPTTTTAVRFFTRHTSLASHSHTQRPQLPFLTVPLSAWKRNRQQHQQHQQFRYLTTERKRWLAHEFLTAGKYTVSLWAILGLTVAIYWSLQQEWLERQYPTPREWTYLTRARARMARWAPDRTDVPATDWVQTGAYAKNVVERLEDPDVDGGGGGGGGALRDLSSDDDGAVGRDATAASEPWRRGYHQMLMLCGRAAEHLDDQVVDTTRHLVFPAAQVQGPSNPHPAPIAPGSPPAPREEDCERAYDPPETYYRRVLTTRGFTARQKMEAALAHAAWLDFKGAPDAAAAAAAAERMYECALALATESSPLPPPYDAKTYVLRDDGDGDGAEGRKPSANVLASLTALATHKARSGDVEAALPILISILRARRSLPSPPPQQPRRRPSSAMAAVSSEAAFGGDPGTGATRTSSPWSMENIASLIKSVVLEPAYPPPPDDGAAPPVRDPGELCEEAGLNLYIGEIIYAMSSPDSNGGENSSRGKNGSRSGREDGLAWTREAVDLAEEQLHKLKLRSSSNNDDAQAVETAKKTCKDCLESGLLNWATMVERLAREEKEKKEREKERKTAAAAAAKSGWLGLWGEGSGSGSSSGSGSGGGREAVGGEEESEKSVGRWEAEEQVVRERTRRARDIIDELEAPKTGIAALVWA